MASLGTRAFLPALLAQLNSASAPLDPVVFQSILLVLAAGQRKHLILNATDPEEIGIIARTTEWILSAVFNLPTHRLKIRAVTPKSPDTDAVNPAFFLRSLFLSSSSSAEASYDERTPSYGSVSQLATHRTSSAHSNKKRPSGSIGLTDPFTDPPDDTTLPSSSYPNRRVPIAHPRHSVTSQHSKSKFKARMPSTVTTDAPRIPTALVVAGLEHASDISQRALVRVLAEGRIVLPKTAGGDEWPAEEEEAWDLPEDFIMVYVTSWDPRERPAIHKSLLDKFAMSTNITLQSKTKQALRSISTGSTIVQSSFATQPNSPPFHSHSIPSTPLSASCALPPHPFPRPQTPLQQTSQSPPNTPKSSKANSFLPDHHRVPSNSTFRGQAPSLPHSASPFLASVPLPADTSDPLLNPASNRPPAATADPPLVLPLPATFLPRLRDATAHHTYIPPFLNIYLQDLFTAARFDLPELDGTLLTARAMDDAEKLARACRVLGTELGGWELIREGGRPGTKDKGSEGQGAAINDDDDDDDGSSGSVYEWEFESGYNPSGSAIRVDIGLPGDTHTDAQQQQEVNNKSVDDPPPPKPALNTKQKEKAKMEVVEWRSPTVKVTFNEVVKSRSHTVEPSSSLEGEDSGMTIFDVSEADVARIVPRVVSHRLRIRDSWMDEVLAGAVCGATFSLDKKGKDVPHGMERRSGRDGVEVEVGQEETTIKDVLIRILQRV